MLRGEPGSTVQVKFQRDGFPDAMTATLQRKSIKIRDVPLAKLIGDPQEAVGYVSLSYVHMNVKRCDVCTHIYTHMHTHIYYGHTHSTTYTYIHVRTHTHIPRKEIYCLLCLHAIPLRLCGKCDWHT